MKAIIRKVLLPGVLVAALAGHATAALTWFGPSYPAPGGNSAAGSGTSPIHVGGKTWELTGFDLGASEDLYYGIASTPAIGQNGLGAPMTLASVSGNTAVWTGSITINLASGGPVIRDTRFTLTVTDLADAALPLVDSASFPAFTGVPTGLLLVTDPSGFKANWQFDIDNGSGTYLAAGTIYDGLNTIEGSSLDSSIGGGFYEAIPEPASMVMMAVMGVGGWFTRRRFMM